mmetsp:Transcript_965/g.2714  ORF Transcript_965/g.2714 Transcript_965/m.2714 type:complete len:274 (-) Transcript_965:347-1168(-)
MLRRGVLFERAMLLAQRYKASLSGDLAHTETAVRTQFHQYVPRNKIITRRGLSSLQLLVQKRKEYVFCRESGMFNVMKLQEMRSRAEPRIEIRFAVRRLLQTDTKFCASRGLLQMRCGAQKARTLSVTSRMSLSCGASMLAGAQHGAAASAAKGAPAIDKYTAELYSSNRQLLFLMLGLFAVGQMIFYAVCSFLTYSLDERDADVDDAVRQRQLAELPFGGSKYIYLAFGISALFSVMVWTYSRRYIARIVAHGPSASNLVRFDLYTFSLRGS